jgi:hypothetical protein
MVSSDPCRVKAGKMKNRKNRQPRRESGAINELPEIEPDVEPEDDQEPEIGIDPRLDP